MIVVSPGAYVAERDFSLYAPQLATSVFAMVGSASKGPFDEVTLITDESSLIATFGYPSSSHLGLMAAVHYLRRGRQLLFIRVGTYYTPVTSLTRGVRNADNTIDTIVFLPTSAGSWVNNVSIVIAAGTIAGTYRVTIRETIRDRTYTVETYDNLLLGAALVDDTNYITTRMNGLSDRVTVAVSDTAPTTLLAGTYTFPTGDDGTPVDDSAIIGLAGSPPTVPATGLQLLRNAETLDVNMVSVPGRAEDNVVAELISVCQDRGDCIAIITVPYGKTVQEAVDWHNGAGGGVDDPSAALNTSYAALYYPWLQVYDGYSDTDIWIPADGHVAGVMAYTDYVANPWSAPAGLNRALLSDVLDLEHSATQGERDWMYSYGNAVNPICNYQSQGYTIWGQRTLQRAPTALDRINVRRLLLYMEKIIATSVRYLVFEPNDEATWRRFVNLVEPICRSIKAQRGLYDFRVICDSTTNTPAVINRNEMVGKILMQPTKTAEMLTVQFVLLPTGARFEEFAGI